MRGLLLVRSLTDQFALFGIERTMRRGQQFFEVCDGSCIGRALRPDSKGIGKSIRMFEVKSVNERRQPFFGQNSSMAIYC